MPFPEVQRVIYQKNPLDQVICQLRFPPILKIEAEIPAEFQEMIRHDFPNYSETTELKIEIPPEIKESMPAELFRQILPPPGGKNYEFQSEDGLWKVNLTRTFLALSTKKYERWEHFKEQLRIPLNALINAYAPSYYSRIGLRYIDIIKRSKLGLSDVGWEELLNPYVVAMLASDIRENIKSFESRYEIRLSDGMSQVRMVTRFVESVEDGEICYMIDNDFFNTDKTEIGAASSILDYFNIRGSRSFQWCITDRLHQAMEPQTL